MLRLDLQGFFEGNQKKTTNFELQYPVTISYVRGHDRSAEYAHLPEWTIRTTAV